MQRIDSFALQARRNLFVERGETISSWAKSHGFDAQLVYAVLAGRLAARRGRAHQIAVALGLKPMPEESSTSACPASIEQQIPSGDEMPK